MKLKTRTLPFGAIPYDNVSAAAKMIAKLFEQTPFLPLMPKIDPSDNLIKRTLTHIPGIVFDDNGTSFSSTTKSYKQELVKLEKAFNKCEKKFLNAFPVESVFMEKYLALIKKFRPANACISLLGPFTISQIVKNLAEEQLLNEKSFRKLFIRAVAVKALWMIDKIREANLNTTPIIILEEPKAGLFGSIKRENENITSDLMIHIYECIIEKIHEAGALVAVHSNEKCDWTIPIRAGVDIISFDAYNNPNNLCIISDVIVDFVRRGGLINWAIVPVLTETMVKQLNIDYVANRLKSTMAGLILAGAHDYIVYDSAMVSIQNNVDHLPLIFAEKALILSTQLAGRIPRAKKKHTTVSEL